MSLVLTVVRHGDTFVPREAPRRIGAATDLPLVASGEAQARALGRVFAPETFDRVLVSPLRRTWLTATLLLEGTVHPAIETTPWLAEIDHGPDENQPEDRVLARIGPAALMDWNEALVAPLGWRVDAEARISAWRALLAEGTGHILLVTSAGVARYALAADPRLTEQAAALPSRKLRTGAWGRIVVAGGQAAIVDWDRRPDAV